MATQKKQTPPGAPRPALPPLRAWHVIMAHGGDQTVTAHECDVYNGVLTFSTIFHDTYVMVGAFGPAAWHDAHLVDVPVAAPNVGP